MSLINPSWKTIARMCVLVLSPCGLLQIMVGGIIGDWRMIAMGFTGICYALVISFGVERANGPCGWGKVNELWLVLEGGADYDGVTLVAVCTNQDSARAIRDEYRSGCLPWNTSIAIRVTSVPTDQSCRLDDPDDDEMGLVDELPSLSKGTKL